MWQIVGYMDTILPSHLLVDIASFGVCRQVVAPKTKETVHFVLYLCFALYGIYRTHVAGGLFVVSYYRTKF
jgi:hypothetical protein